MRIFQCQQGSEEWLRARLGIPTASCFDKIVTPTGKSSAQWEKYAATLLCEWYLDQPDASFLSEYVDRGTKLEDEAAAAWEFETGIDTTRAGLVLSDDGRIGASPDRFAGPDGLVELKCAAGSTHMLHLIQADGARGEYKCQTQGQLWITGREWVDLYFWHPVFPAVTVRYERDDEFIKVLSAGVIAFADKLDQLKAKYAEQRAAYLAARSEVMEDHIF